MRALLGKLCVGGSLLCLRASLHGTSSVSFSVSRVHFGIISGGITGHATVRRGFVRPMEACGHLAAISNGTAMHGVFILPGLALPSSGLLMIRVCRGNNTHRRSFHVRGASLITTGPIDRLRLGWWPVCGSMCTGGVVRVSDYYAITPYKQDVHTT